MFGNCVICGEFLDEKAYDEQRVIALLGPQSTVVFCVKHVDPKVIGDPRGSGQKQYLDVLERVALAQIAQLQKG